MDYIYKFLITLMSYFSSF